MAKKTVRNRAALIEKKRGALATAQAEVVKLSSKLDTLRGKADRLDVSDSEKAVKDLAKLTGEIASSETVLRALEAKRDRAQVELDELLATVDQDEIDRLKTKELDVLRLAVTQVQELYGTMENLREAVRALQAAGGRPEDVILPKVYQATRATMEHLRVYHPEMIGLPPRRSTREMQAVALRRQNDSLRKLLSEVEKHDRALVGNLPADYRATIKRNNELLKRLGQEPTEDAGIEAGGMVLPSLSEFA